MATATVKVSPSLVKVLKVIHLNKRVTPDKINDHMGNEYASKHICNLRKLGFEFETEKEGRKITSYKLVKEPDNVEEIRKPAPKAKAEKAAKPAKEKKEKPVKAAGKKADAKAKNLAKLKEVDAKRKAKVVEIEDEDASADRDVEVVSVSAIDPDFDSMEGVDLKSLVE